MATDKRKSILDIAQDERDSWGDPEDFNTEDMCYGMSKSLVKELRKEGYDAELVRGTFPLDNPKYSQEEDEEIYDVLHYWVEIDGMVLDIAADQFNAYLDGDEYGPITYAPIQDLPHMKATAAKDKTEVFQGMAMANLDLTDFDSARNWAIENIDDDDMGDEHRDPMTGMSLDELVSEYMSTYRDLHNQDSITLYRGVRLDRIEDLNTEKLGNFYSYDIEGVGDYGASGQSGKLVILTVEVSPQYIDWEYGFESFLAYGPSQSEIYVKPGSSVKIIAIDEKPLDEPMEATATKKDKTEVFLGGGVQTDWREEVKKVQKGLDLIDPVKDDYDPAVDIYQEIGDMLEADEVVFLEGGDQTKEEKKLLDRLDVDYEEFDDLDELQEHLDKITAVLGSAPVQGFITPEGKFVDHEWASHLKWVVKNVDIPESIKQKAYDLWDKEELWDMEDEVYNGAFDLGYVRIVETGDISFNENVSKAAFDSAMRMVKNNVWDGYKIGVELVPNDFLVITNKMEYGEAVRYFREKLGFGTTAAYVPNIKVYYDENDIGIQYTVIIDGSVYTMNANGDQNLYRGEESGLPAGRFGVEITDIPPGIQKRIDWHLGKTAVITANLSQNGWIKPNGTFVLLDDLQSHGQWVLENNISLYDYTQSMVDSDELDTSDILDDLYTAAYDAGYVRVTADGISFSDQVTEAAFNKGVEIVKDQIWNGLNSAMDLDTLNRDFKIIHNKVEFAQAIRHFREKLGFGTTASKTAGLYASELDDGWIHPDGEVDYFDEYHAKYAIENGFIEPEEVPEDADDDDIRVKLIVMNKGYVRIGAGGISFTDAVTKKAFDVGMNILKNSGFQQTFYVEKLGATATAGDIDSMPVNDKYDWNKAKKHFYTELGFGTTASIEDAAFKSWFGSSKVTDNEGNPLVVYHGTTETFDVFEKGDIGFHFGTEGQALDRGAENAGNWQDAIVGAYYLSLQNPLEWWDLGDWTDMEMWQEYISSDDYDTISKKEAKTLKNVDDVKALLISKGYDGIKYLNYFEGRDGVKESDNYAYIAFSPNQIKSVDAVEFSTENPSVMASIDAIIAAVAIDDFWIDPNGQAQKVEKFGHKEWAIKNVLGNNFRGRAMLDVYTEMYNMGYSRFSMGNYTFGENTTEASFTTGMSLIRDMVWADEQAIVSFYTGGDDRDSTVITNKMEFGKAMRHYREVLPSIATIATIKAALQLSADYEHGCLMIPVPKEVRDMVLKEIAPTIDFGDLNTDKNETLFGVETETHITLLYGPEGDIHEAIAKYFTAPIKIKTTGEIKYFDNEDASVAYVAIESPELHELHNKLKGALENSQREGEYVPHITIAYLEPGARLSTDKAKVFEWEVSKIINGIADGTEEEILVGGAVPEEHVKLLAHIKQAFDEEGYADALPAEIYYENSDHFFGNLGNNEDYNDYAHWRGNFYGLPDMRRRMEQMMTSEVNPETSNTPISDKSAEGDDAGATGMNNLPPDESPGKDYEDFITTVRTDTDVPRLE